MNWLVTAWLRRFGGTPCFRVYGKTHSEASWREIEVYATHRRDMDSRWPFLSGSCTTWSDCVVSVGWDFAEDLLREQIENPASREHPVVVAGGRLRDLTLRLASGASSVASASEILAHEIGHTGQARRLGVAYLPLVGSVTLFREGPNWWNHFENDASESGQFGGIVPGSVCPRLQHLLKQHRDGS
ncbi:MAG: hypothetical protein KatS3mg105_4619 [Gemmatales bacterium]|nr:MAG: hypothetical protein KatS3mg105_4619 [Gemmatales bacterium]